MRCELCGDVIGVYEPVIVVHEGFVRETSVFAEPALHEQPGALQHRACFDAASSGEGAS